MTYIHWTTIAVSVSVDTAEDLARLELAVEDAHASGRFGPATLAQLRELLAQAIRDTAQMEAVAEGLRDWVLVAGDTAPADRATLVWLATTARHLAAQLGWSWTGPLPIDPDDLFRARPPDVLYDLVDRLPADARRQMPRRLPMRIRLAEALLQTAWDVEMRLPAELRPGWRPEPSSLERELLGAGA